MSTMRSRSRMLYSKFTLADITRHFFIYSNFILLTILPIPSTYTSTSSPSFKKPFGSMNNPTPLGVPCRSENTKSVYVSLAIHTVSTYRQNDSSSPQRSPPTQMLQHLTHLADHIISSSFLPLLPIDFCPVLQFLRIGNQLWRNNTRSYRRKLIKRLCISKLAAGYRSG